MAQITKSEWAGVAQAFGLTPASEGNIPPRWRATSAGGGGFIPGAGLAQFITRLRRKPSYWMVLIVAVSRQRPFAFRKSRERASAETLAAAKRKIIGGGIVLFALALIACSGKPYAVEPEQKGEAVSLNPLFVVSHGWHTGLIIPARHLNDVVPELEGRFGPVPYYEIGWGDKAFYQAREITTGLTLQAIFRSEGAVLHVVAIPGDPRDYFSGSEVLETCIPESGLSSLKTFLAGSFARDSAGRLIALSKGIYRDSQFYHGVGRYNLLNTSNKWTAKALRSAGMDISPAFRLTAGSVMSYLRSNRRPCATAAGALQ